MADGKIEISPAKARIVVQQAVHHSHAHESPKSVNHLHSQWLESDDEPYKVKLKVDTEWQQLLGKYCHIESASYLQLRNEEGVFPHRIPTPKQIKDAADRVIELGIAVDGKVVPTEIVVTPQQAVCIEVADFKKFYVRCRVDEVAILSLTLYPR